MVLNEGGWATSDVVFRVCCQENGQVNRDMSANSEERAFLFNMCQPGSPSEAASAKVTVRQQHGTESEAVGVGFRFRCDALGAAK
jgi:hypothetical protein